MPLGWERINAKKLAPNKNIVFIKPRPGPEEQISKDFLERIAAQCLPIMNHHHLSVVSLEEYEPNLEFWGRNFNNGEVIQLVLKSPTTGRWLPFRFVQMVMIHELAHNKQMNHSKAFWAVRNEFSTEMKMLWEKGYTGDGLWGRGVLLENGQFSHEQLGEGEVLPEHMCGGGFVSRRNGKRKMKPKITYKEAKERRIKKKFGENGKALGADDETKVKLENGRRPIGKPRVASSKRGRELRAAAALARFDESKKDPHIKDEDLVTDSESEADDHIAIKTEEDDAVDINGKKLIDSNGRGMVRVCEDEDKDDNNAKLELLELQAADFPQPRGGLISKGFKARDFPTEALLQKKKQQGASDSSLSKTSEQVKIEDESTESEDNKSLEITSEPSTNPSGMALTSTSSTKPIQVIPIAQEESFATQRLKNDALVAHKSLCPVCSVENQLTALTCLVCSNVLQPEFVPDSWWCTSSTCKDSVFINAGDVALCGVCGARKNSLV